MAQNRKRASGGAARPATRSESKKPAVKAAPATVEIVEEEKGMGVDDGMIILTAILMLAAFLMLDYHRGTNYGEGMMFKDNYKPITAAANT